ncbi:NADH-quinone oxidoreductase subunit L [bacterium]|nr:NADH-quinone oxidoreductase subunit L [bacterium]
MISLLLWVVPLAPLVGMLVASLLSLTGARRAGHYVVIGAIGLSTAATLLVLANCDSGAAQTAWGYRWLHAGSFNVNISLRSDPLTLTLLPIVTGVSFLVACYSVGYMTHDRGFTRYFAIFAGFVFCMTMLVLAGNLLMLYAFWEGVGLCSYLLIGFWYQRPSAAAAATKAFLVNRIADAGFLAGILLLWRLMTEVRPDVHDEVSLLDFGQIFAAIGDLTTSHPSSVTLVGFLLLLGAIGKSAQFPLHVWLPDAMEGPTPVSALIHAATMVTAGVYLLARMMPLLVHTPAVLVTAASLGAATALIGAILALGQTDLKRILAYSTISQLGYMFMAIGSAAESHLVGPAVAAAMFHLVTHAFFKATLFLSAGNVMHAMGDVIDLRRIAGLRQVLPVTHGLFLVGALALAGIPPLAGFWSKDAILAVIDDATHGPAGTIYRIIFVIAAISAFLTAVYTMRAYFGTFLGKKSIPEEAGHHPHEAHPTMLIAIAVLAGASLLAGGILASTGAIDRMIGQIPSLAMEGSHHESSTIMILSSAISLIGLFVAWISMAPFPFLASSKPSRLWTRLQEIGQRRLYIDEIYAVLFVRPAETLSHLLAWMDSVFIDGMVGMIARVPTALGVLARQRQTGLIPSYSLMMVAGLVVILYWSTR